MLKNPHALLLVLKPKPGLEDENNAVLEQKMTRLKKGLSPDSLLSLIRETRELIAFQKREDTSEALATIPLLDLKDIRPRADWFDIAQSRVNGVPVLLHDTFTNGVTYVTFHFDARVLPDSLIPYASLLTELLGSLDTGNMSYGELNNTLNVFTGGFNTALAVYPKDQDDRFLLPKFEVSSKAMNNRTDKLFDLAAEIITRTRFDDPDRLKTVLLRHQSRLEARIKRAGLNYALSRLASYMTNQGLFNEKVRGIEYYKFITGLTENIDGKTETLTSNLSKTAGLLFARGNLTVALTCPKKDFDAASASLARFLEILPDRKDEITPWNFVLEKKNEGLCTASKVQYVTKGYDFKKLGYTWTGKMRVLNQVLSSEWLQNQIRVIGGAYGGFSIISPDGQFQFASYRDPNLGGNPEELRCHTGLPQEVSGGRAGDDPVHHRNDRGHGSAPDPSSRRVHWPFSGFSRTPPGNRFRRNGTRFSPPRPRTSGTWKNWWPALWLKMPSACMGTTQGSNPKKIFSATWSNSPDDRFEELDVRSCDLVPLQGPGHMNC